MNNNTVGLSPVHYILIPTSSRTECASGDQVLGSFENIHFLLQSSSHWE